MSFSQQLVKACEYKKNTKNTLIGKLLRRDEKIIELETIIEQLKNKNYSQK